MEQISVRDAAERKGCSVQAVRDAIRIGLIDAVKIGRPYIVMVTEKFNDWQPNPKIQAAGRARWEDKKA